MSKTEYQIETQSDLIKQLWVRNEQLQKRADTQQGMIDWLQRRVAELEQKTTPQALVELAFKGVS